MNDPANTIIHIWGKPDNTINKDGTISGLLETELGAGGFIRIKSEDKYLAYGRVKVPFRKTLGDSTKIVLAVKKYFLTMKKVLQDNRDKLTDEHLSIIGDKF